MKAENKRHQNLKNKNQEKKMYLQLCLLTVTKLSIYLGCFYYYFISKEILFCAHFTPNFGEIFN